MTAIIIGFLVILVSAGLAIVGNIIVHRLIGIDELKNYNNVAGNMFQVVGTLFAVLLGLIVVDAMTSMNDLRVTVEQEANAVTDIFILSSGLPSSTGIKVRALAKAYVDTVVDEEWEAMQNCSFSREAAISAHGLWQELIQCQPENDSQNEIRSLALSEMSVFSDNRRKRLVSSTHGVSNILWMVLITGALFIVSFTYFFGLDNTVGQFIMTGIVASSVSLNVYLVYLFGYPFSGVYRLEPEGFVAARAIFSVQEHGIESIPKLKNLNIQEIKDVGGKLEKLKH